MVPGARERIVAKVGNEVEETGSYLMVCENFEEQLFRNLEASGTRYKSGEESAERTLVHKLWPLIQTCS